MNTPNINSLLAVPFKKEPVPDREEFLGTWNESKEYVRKASGSSGTYHANKSQRLSEEFNWPSSSSLIETEGNQHTITI